MVGGGGFFDGLRYGWGMYGYGRVFQRRNVRVLLSYNHVLSSSFQNIPSMI